MTFLDQYFNMIMSNFGDFKKIFANIKDYRQQNLITYPKEILYLYTLLTFIFKENNTFDLYFKLLNEQDVINNFKLLCGDNYITQIPHYNTDRNILLKTNPNDVYKSLKKLVNNLLRKKTFNKYKFLNKYFLVAIDATQQTYTENQLSDKCIKMVHNKGTINERTTYHYYILSARIVFPNGFTIPLATEFIENDEKFYNKEKMKQDCEIKGAYRILKKIKKLFPQQPFCMLFDSLYVNEKIFSICNNNKWGFIVNYKEAKATSIYNEFNTLKKDNLIFEKNITFSDEESKTLIKQEIQYTNMLNYHDISINIIEVNNISTKLDKQNNEKTEEKYFMYVTNINIKKDNVFELINYGGRQRWKIENQGFNEEKNNGYNLKHLYSKDNEVRKVYYYFMQMGHLLNNLFENGILNKKEIKKKFKTILNISKKLSDLFVYKKININNFEKSNYKFNNGLKYEILDST